MHDASAPMAEQRTKPWLAAYARVDATLTHPLDPVTTAATVTALLRARLDRVPAVS